MASKVSTKDCLLQILDDVEIIMKGIIENSLSNKNEKMVNKEHALMLDLLFIKEKKFKKMVVTAKKQYKVEIQISFIKAKLDDQDREIVKLQTSLKEAESILSQTIFEARRKLDKIKQASKRPLSSEELIEYAHHISKDSTAYAPDRWLYGDYERPYPTDLDIRNGFLGNIHFDFNMDYLLVESNLEDTPPTPTDVPSSYQNQIDCTNLDELHMDDDDDEDSFVPLEGRSHNDATQDDVEVMSTDSSSSSSSSSDSY